MKRQQTFPIIEQIEKTNYHMAALSIVTRMYLTRVVKDAIIRGLKRAGLNLSDMDRDVIANHIMDEMGADTEKLIGIVRTFFEKSDE